MRCSSGFNPWSIALLIFVNDLQHVTKFLDLIMFADDINLFYSNSNINELFENVNTVLVNITDWCFANKLLINPNKTISIFFISERIGIMYP